ncbi:hypothetical protein PHYSODRAFT_333862 [Phytophthora sojae]|uniref:Uncharacterized protein n=1 Tax=Phytophthora sojae (strain P6497) TaxID=1094619 RepID=G4ZM11_PHYSP|nr:hypothetical protein PHYSODRAFT_333862 [Phytophthora sojae]EGZ15639.1 hypothetical protein PHYSODRAFT_333862 [Phytophthora sojae]|eukprot:XP_009529388.1 hypothetical protein PHYSODRAFT_333862 [Phytophthora sojae]
MVKEHLRKEDLLAIVLWLEHRPNFEKCFGVSKQTSVGKKPASKSDGFREMAAALQRMKDRFQTYKARFMKAKEYEASTGAGITPDDEAAGVYAETGEYVSLVLQNGRTVLLY